MKKYQNRLIVVGGCFIFLLLYLFYGPLAQGQKKGVTVAKFSIMILLPLLACGGYNLWQFLGSKKVDPSKKDTSQFFEE